MDFALSEEHKLLRATVREFAEAEIAPHAAGWDERHELPLDVVRAMGDLGLFGLVFPEEYGGADGDFLSLCIAIEEIARVDSSLAITLEAGVAGRLDDARMVGIAAAAHRVGALGDVGADPRRTSHDAPGPAPLDADPSRGRRHPEANARREGRLSWSAAGVLYTPP